MKYHIQPDSHIPAYLQLYNQLRADITGGIYTYGTKLPSKRLLAEETGVSVITVQHTYAILCDEGYAESRQRSGYFVIYRENDFNSSPSQKPQSEHDMPNVHTQRHGISFPVMSRTMRRVMLDYGERILEKSPNHGCAELRAAISAYLARSSGINADRSQIIIGSGAEYLYSLIVQLFGTDRIYAIEDPSYEKIRGVYTANGAVCDKLKLGKDGIITSELERTEATVLHITPYSSYPSGITAAASKRAEYIDWATKRGGYIIEDNYDSELTVSTKNEDTVFSLDKEGRAVYLNTFSRTVSPSLRVGYMVLPKTLLAEFERKLGFYSCTVPVFEQYVLAELITSGDFERHINRVRRSRRREMRG